VNGSTDCGAAWFLARAIAKLLTAKGAKIGHEVRKQRRAHSSSAGVSPAVRRASRQPSLNGKHAGRMPALPAAFALRAFVVNTKGLRFAFQQRINLTDTGFGGIEWAGVVDDVVGLLNFL
jgi:hypothetical protein